VPVMTLELTVKDTPVFLFVPKNGPKDIGDRLFFSDRLAVTKIDGTTVGNVGVGLPAGTHSGFLTALRFLEVADPYLPDAELLWQQQATYRLNAVAGNLPAGLKEGQITAQGVVRVANHEPVGNEIRFAITGGTEAYANARGQVTETDKGKFKTLKIEL
jgi:hypothetical protein